MTNARFQKRKKKTKNNEKKGREIVFSAEDVIFARFNPGRGPLRARIRGTGVNDTTQGGQ